jgi:hypothetical protein
LVGWLVGRFSDSKCKLLRNKVVINTGNVYTFDPNCCNEHGVLFK